MDIKDQSLFDSLVALLNNLDESGEIVVCTGDSKAVAKKIHDLVLAHVPNTSLSTQELYGVRSLLLEAVKDKSFFDWEMPTLTGFNAEQFQNIANKLPRE